MLFGFRTHQIPVGFRDGLPEAASNTIAGMATGVTRPLNCFGYESQIGERPWKSLGRYCLHYHMQDLKRNLCSSHDWILYDW